MYPHDYIPPIVACRFKKDDYEACRHGGNEFTETLVLRIDLGDGLVSAVDAGSPRILRLRGARVPPIELENQMPLGMFAETDHDVQRFRLESGDRLVIVSDGVYSAVNPSGDDFGAEKPEQLIRRTRPQDTAEVPLSIIAALLEYLEGRDLEDDAVAICLDWK